MTPFGARCFLVGSAIVLAVAGVVVPVSGTSRVVVLAAAGCCAALDVVLTRSTLRSEPIVDEVVLGPPATVPGLVPESLDGVLQLGTAVDGGLVEVASADGAHLVVAGTGVLATAVFRALSAQVQTTAIRSGALVRAASAPALRGALPGWIEAADGDAPRQLPGDHAAFVSDPAGPTETTLVLVPGTGSLPRTWDLAIEVTRYGCTVRRPGEPRGTRISPTLPLLGTPS